MRPAVFLALVVAGCSAPPAPPPGGVRVAAAASLKPAFDELVAGFRDQHPDYAVTVTYGASGGFVAQIANGATFDVFLSADNDGPRRLAELGLAAPDGVFPFATGKLVVWVRDGDHVPLETDGLRAVANPGVRAVALANPRHAPFGRAAEAALRHVGAWDAVRERVVLGENVEQAAGILRTGAATVGLLPAGTAAAVPGGRTWPVPADLYPPIELAGVVLARAADPAAATALRAHVVGPAGRAVLARHGFGPPAKK